MKKRGDTVRFNDVHFVVYQIVRPIAIEGVFVLPLVFATMPLTTSELLVTTPRGQMIAQCWNMRNVSEKAFGRLGDSEIGILSLGEMDRVRFVVRNFWSGSDIPPHVAEYYGIHPIGDDHPDLEQYLRSWTRKVDPIQVDIRAELFGRGM